MPPVLQVASAAGAARRARARDEPKPEPVVRVPIPIEPEKTDEIFNQLDVSHDGKISKEELGAHFKKTGVADAEVDKLFEYLDKDGNGVIDREELRNGIAEYYQPPSPPGKCQAIFEKVIELLNTMTFQTVMYFAFVLVFQLLLASMRAGPEYYLDKYIADTFIENHFDSSHNTLESIRRIGDIWEWGNVVLWPGLMGNIGPCDGDQRFVHGAYATSLSDVLSVKQCNDDVWMDGEGSFHMGGANAFSVEELTEQMDTVGWMNGISIRQVRVSSRSDEGADNCAQKTFSGKCNMELGAWPGENPDTFGKTIDSPPADETGFAGFNWTATPPGSAPLDHPWSFKTAKQLGSDPKGQVAAHLASFRTYDAGGYVAFVLPFFSTTYLEEQHGLPSEVTDFREYQVSPGDGSKGRIAKYFCVRLSPNGDYVRQVCDKNDPATGRTTGVVRAAIEGFWNDLKRAHFLDGRTRLLHITITFKSNNNAVGTRANLMFEFTGSGSILPSYDLETFVTSEQKREQTQIYMHIAIALVVFFIILEAVEMHDTGISGYFGDGWNVLDWINFILLILLYAKLTELFTLADAPSLSACQDGATICTGVGYWDDWEYVRCIKECKLYLSFNVNIQLLKVIKFLNQLVPKTSLAVNVLHHAMADLIFFSTVFFITILAFSNMFYVQLGPVMEGYYSQFAAIITLARALFGDFDIDDIFNNSNGYLNVALFLAYLFVALFIILSIFLTILGEAQAAVSAETEKKKEKGEYKEYGVIEDLTKGLSYLRHKVVAHFRPISVMDSLHVESSGVVEIRNLEDVTNLLLTHMRRQKDDMEAQNEEMMNDFTKACRGLGLMKDVLSREASGSTPPAAKDVAQAQAATGAAGASAAAKSDLKPISEGKMLTDIEQMEADKNNKAQEPRESSGGDGC